MIYKQNKRVFWACKSLESLPADWSWSQKSNCNFGTRAQNPSDILTFEIFEYVIYLLKKYHNLFSIHKYKPITVILYLQIQK